MNKAPIAVSIIVPVFNAGKHLSQCLDSLVNQMNEGLEVICIDDCSTDNSWDVLVGYQQAYPGLVKLIKSKTNSGPGNARNLGIEAANGEYLFFVDADDWLPKGAISRLLAETLQTNADIIDCDWYVYHGAEKPLEIESFDLSKCTGPRTETTIDERIILPHTPIWGKFIRKSLFTENGTYFPSYSIGEDMIMAVVRAQADKCIVINEPLYYYRRDTQSLTRQRNSSKYAQVRKSALFVLNKFKENGIYANHKDAVDFLMIRKHYRQWLVYLCFYFDKVDTSLLRKARQDMDALVPNWRVNPFLGRLPLFDKLILKTNDFSPFLLARISGLAMKYFSFALPRHIPRLART